MLVGPVALVDTVPGEFAKTAGQAQQAIADRVQRSDDPVEQTMGSIAYVYGLAGELMGILAIAEAQGQLVGLPFSALHPEGVLVEGAVVGQPMGKGGICQLRVAKQQPTLRLDYHAIRPNGPNRLHIDSPRYGLHHWPSASSPRFTRCRRIISRSPGPTSSDARDFHTGGYRPIVQISTDGFSAYPEAVDLAFGPYAKFGTIIKEYRNASIIYTPSEMVGHGNGRATNG